VASNNWLGLPVWFIRYSFKLFLYLDKFQLFRELLCGRQKGSYLYDNKGCAIKSYELVRNVVNERNLSDRSMLITIVGPSAELISGLLLQLSSRI
jgi:hypothetical protein